MNGEEFGDIRLTADQSAHVRELQTYLRRLANDDNTLPLIGIDGIYGPETREAVMRFQETGGLPVTGIVNFATWEAVVDAYRRPVILYGAAVPIRVSFPAEKVLRLGDDDPAVRFLQEMINALALRYSNIPAVARTGVFDEQTSQAVRQAQRTRGVSESGELDRETWDALAELYNNLAQLELAQANARPWL